MQSRSGNPLSTLMLSLPLMAIPLMAVFGVPQFVPVVASSTSEPDIAPLQPTRVQRVGESATPRMLVADEADNRDASVGALDDLFRPNEQPRSRQRLTRTALNTAPSLSSARSRQLAQHDNINEEIDTAGGRDSATDARLAELFGLPASAADQPSDTQVEKKTANDRNRLAANMAAIKHANLGVPSADEGLTWRQAVQQLNELGIHDFRLEAGHAPGDFYFACDFAPNGNARVVRRFEAEASEPLRAVEMVLQQIRDWNSQR